MSDIPNKSKLDDYVKMGLVRSQTHPTLPLSIYVYTELTSFERLWNNVTMSCRGLVVDDKGRCIVRCLPKFFNEGEPHLAPELGENTPIIYFDKLDGSLIQVVNDPEYGVVVTSKGSFASDQSKWAEQIIEIKGYLFQQGLTYVFELIHPENRIVLDYGGKVELVLLAVIETETGNEKNIDKFTEFEHAEKVFDPAKHMRALVEGVVKKQGNYRVKIKTEEYVRLHRIVTDFTEKRVWEALKDGQSLEFENMPEEFEQWLEETTKTLTAQFQGILDKAKQENIRAAKLTDKELGLSNGYDYKHLVFAIRNGRDVEQTIWKMIKPKKEVENVSN